MANTSTQVVQIEADLEPLVQKYLKNKIQQVDDLKKDLEKQDFENLRMTGHKMQGASRVYGFNHIAELGKKIEDAAKEKDSQTIQTQISAFDLYLKEVRVEFA